MRQATATPMLALFSKRPRRAAVRYCALGVMALACIPAFTGCDPPEYAPEGIPGTWHLVFQDTFQGNSLDPTKWTIQPGTAWWDVSEGGGTLNLTYDGSEPVVSTAGHFTFQYGAMEALVYLPAGPPGEVANDPGVESFGAPEANDPSAWPADGEDDAMEGLGGPAAYVFHSAAGNGPPHWETGLAYPPGDWTGWHTFAADWEPGSVSYYWDGKYVGSITSGVTSVPMYINLLYGWRQGDYTADPATMRVAYVRVWQH